MVLIKIISKKSHTTQPKDTMYRGPSGIIMFTAQVRVMLGDVTGTDLNVQFCNIITTGQKIEDNNLFLTLKYLNTFNLKSGY